MCGVFQSRFPSQHSRLGMTELIPLLRLGPRESFAVCQLALLSLIQYSVVVLAFVHVFASFFFSFSFFPFGDPHTSVESKVHQSETHCL